MGERLCPSSCPYAGKVDICDLNADPPRIPLGCPLKALEEGATIKVQEVSVLSADVQKVAETLQEVEDTDDRKDLSSPVFPPLQRGPTIRRVISRGRLR